MGFDFGYGGKYNEILSFIVGFHVFFKLAKSYCIGKPITFKCPTALQKFSLTILIIVVPFLPKNWLSILTLMDCNPLTRHHTTCYGQDSIKKTYSHVRPSCGRFDKKL